MGKQNMYEHSIGVPFIIAGPGIPKDCRTRAQIYLRDMYPTTCELAGIPIPKTVEAKSFVPVLRGEKKQIHPEIYGYFYNYQRMVRTDRWKLIHYPHLKRYQLFDLKNDPDEVNDLSKKSDQQKRVKNLNRKLTAWFEARESSIPK